jgi:hypothetical protein
VRGTRQTFGNILTPELWQYSYTPANVPTKPDIVTKREHRNIVMALSASGEKRAPANQIAVMATDEISPASHPE